MSISYTMYKSHRISDSTSVFMQHENIDRSREIISNNNNSFLNYYRIFSKIFHLKFHVLRLLYINLERNSILIRVQNTNNRSVICWIPIITIILKLHTCWYSPR